MTDDVKEPNINTAPQRQESSDSLWQRPRRNASVREILAGLGRQQQRPGDEALGDEALGDEALGDEAPANDGMQPEDEQSAGGAKDDGAKPKEESQPKQPDEVAKLRHELASAMGRLKPAQQRIEVLQSEKTNLQSQLDAAHRRIAELEAGQQDLEDLRRTKKTQDVRAKLLEQFPDIDPAYAEALVMAAGEMAQPAAKPQQTSVEPPAGASQSAPAVGQVSFARAKMEQILADHRRNSGSLTVLAGDPEFRSWVESRPDVGARLTQFTQSTSVEDVENLAEQLDKDIDAYYLALASKQDDTPISTPVAQPATGVASMARRNGGRTISRQEYERKRAELMAKIRGRDPKAREDATKELQALQTQFRQS